MRRPRRSASHMTRLPCSRLCKHRCAVDCARTSKTIRPPFESFAFASRNRFKRLARTYFFLPRFSGGGGGEPGGGPAGGGVQLPPPPLRGTSPASLSLRGGGKLW